MVAITIVVIMVTLIIFKEMIITIVITTVIDMIMIVVIIAMMFTMVIMFNAGLTYLFLKLTFPYISPQKQQLLKLSTTSSTF